VVVELTVTSQLPFRRNTLVAPVGAQLIVARLPSLTTTQPVGGVVVEGGDVVDGGNVVDDVGGGSGKPEPA
jgi:hypothetical protein